MFGSLGKIRGGVIELLDYNLFFTDVSPNIRLFASKINWVGCAGSDVFGEPIDLLNEPKVIEILKKKTYAPH
jgi:hypothetical protein